MVLVVERWRARADASQVGLRAKRQHTGRSGSSWLWTTEEDAAVRRLAPDAAAIFVALNGRRTRNAISKRIALFLGARRVPWTGAEIAKLRRLYKKVSLTELREHFPGRTDSALQSQARRLRITGREGAPWKELGIYLFDEIVRRSKALGFRRYEVLQEAGVRRSFKKAYSLDWREMSASWKSVLRLIDFLGGTLRLEWQPA